MAFSLIEVKKSIMITDNFWAQAAIIINLSTMSTISATIGLSNDTMMWELVSEHFSEFLCLLLSVYPLSEHLSHFPLFIWHWWKRNEQDADLLHHTLPQISYMQLHLTKILGHVLFLFSILKRKKSAVIFMLTALMATWCFNDSKSFTTLLLKWNFLLFHVQKPLSYFIIGMTKPITIEFFFMNWTKYMGSNMIIAKFGFSHDAEMSISPAWSGSWYHISFMYMAQLHKPRTTSFVYLYDIKAHLHINHRWSYIHNPNTAMIKSDTFLVNQIYSVVWTSFI